MISAIIQLKNKIYNLRTILNTSLSINKIKDLNSIYDNIESLINSDNNNTNDIDFYNTFIEINMKLTTVFKTDNIETDNIENNNILCLFYDYFMSLNLSIPCCGTNDDETNCSNDDELINNIISASKEIVNQIKSKKKYLKYKMKYLSLKKKLNFFNSK